MIKKYVGKYFPVFLLPTVIAFCISFVAPFIIGMYLSFCEFTTVTNARFVGIDNYIKVFTESSDFMNALWFTVKFTVVSVITVNVFAFLLALILTRPMKGTNGFRTGFFMPNLIGGIVLGYIWQIIINGVLGYFGVDITYAAKYGFWGLVMFVGIPLPGTGAWTGCLIAAMLEIDKKKAFLAACIGVLMAGIIMSVLSIGIFDGILG